MAEKPMKEARLTKAQRRFIETAPKRYGWPFWALTASEHRMAMRLVAENLCVVKFVTGVGEHFFITDAGRATLKQGA